MNNFSPEYAALQKQFHVERPDYGVSGHRYADYVASLAKSLKTTDVLDYGCGKCTLAKALPFPIQNYDPFIPEHNRVPSPADLVVCTDVMEHIEEVFVNSVIREIADLAKQAVFFQIATGPASKTLPDGRNAHITQHPGSWWMQRLCSHFEPVCFEYGGPGFIFVGEKLA